MWRDNGVPDGAIASHYPVIVQDYLDYARKELHYQAWIAEVDGQWVGSVGCQLFSGLYPLVLLPTYRQDGYIWGVYVEPEWRQQGIASQLMQEAIAYLKSIGCTRAVLNAAPMGKGVYERLGFSSGNLMQLEL
jgi:GNAT superfamily N-acetyltransferase